MADDIGNELTVCWPPSSPYDLTVFSFLSIVSVGFIHAFNRPSVFRAPVVEVVELAISCDCEVEEPGSNTFVHSWNEVWFGSCRWLVPHRSLSDPILFFVCLFFFVLAVGYQLTSLSPSTSQESFFDPFEQPFSEARLAQKSRTLSSYFCLSRL